MSEEQPWSAGTDEDLSKREIIDDLRAENEQLRARLRAMDASEARERLRSCTTKDEAERIVNALLVQLEIERATIEGLKGEVDPATIDGTIRQCDCCEQSSASVQHHEAAGYLCEHCAPKVLASRESVRLHLQREAELAAEIERLKGTLRDELAKKKQEVENLKNRVYDEMRAGWLSNDRLHEANLAVGRLRAACAKQQHDIQQTLGKALGYPLFPAEFEAGDQVCVGEHTAESLAGEAAEAIERLTKEVSARMQLCKNLEAESIELRAHLAERDARERMVRERIKSLLATDDTATIGEACYQQAVRDVLGIIDAALSATSDEQ